MKNKLLLLLLLAATFFAQAQNIGIGTTAPLSKLHIFNGASGNITPFSPLVVEGNSNTYINLLSPNINETAVLFGKADNAASGAIVYNNVNTLNGFQFRTAGNITQMILNNTGNIGIGVLTPNAKLSISADGTELAGTASGNTFRTNAGVLGNTAGSELSLANIGFLSSNNSSLGIRAYRNSAGTDWTSTALLLGHDVDNTVRAGGAFLALGANGNIGIGIANPQYPLDINGRTRIRSGGNNSISAGLWLNNNANTETAFIGMEDDTHVGFFGIGTGWKFGMNTQTGALKINGSVGNIGQVITSNGATSPSWISPTNFLYNNMQEFTQSSNITITGFSAIPDMTQTITTPACKVLLIVKGFMLNNECFNCGPRSCKYDIWVDGTLIDRNIITVGNGVQAIVSNGGKIHGLTAGAHTIAVNVDGDGKDFYISGFRLVVLVIPQ